MQKNTDYEDELIRLGRVTTDDSALVLFIYSELSFLLKKHNLYLDEKITRTNMRFMLFLFVRHCLYINSSKRFNTVFNDFTRKKHKLADTELNSFIEVLNSMLGYYSHHVYNQLKRNEEILNEKNKKIINIVEKFLQKPVSKKILNMLLSDGVKEQFIHLMENNDKVKIFNQPGITYKKIICFYLRIHCKME